MEKPTTAEEGDMFIDPSTEKTFYFTSGRWIDVTRVKQKKPIQKE